MRGFTKICVQTDFGKQSFNSGNMYQMFTYLCHQPKELAQLRGVLIYPFNGQELHEVYHWDKRTTIEVMTVDLGAKWQFIYEELTQVVHGKIANE